MGICLKWVVHLFKLAICANFEEGPWITRSQDAREEDSMGVGFEPASEPHRNKNILPKDVIKAARK